MKAGLKVASAALAVLSLLGTAVPSAFANPSQQASEAQVIYEQQQVKDIQTLIVRAEKGISDIKMNSPLVSEAEDSYIGSDGRAGKFLIKKYRTAQLLKKMRISNGSVVSSFAVSNISQYYDESQYRSKSDSNIDTTAYSTIYVDDLYLSTGQEYWKLVGVDGGWTIDNNISLTNQSVVQAASGVGYPSGGAVYQSQTYPENGNLTYSINAPSNWFYVSANTDSDPAGTVLGSTSNCTIYRNGTQLTTLQAINDMNLNP